MVAAAPVVDKTDDAKEGTAFHDFAARLLNGDTVAVGDRAANGYLANAEMLNHAEAYAELLKADPSWTQRVEAPLHWGPGGTARDGQGWQVRVKCDCVTWRPDCQTLAVTDAKYGFRYVDPQDNWQLLSQAIGACFALNIQPERIILAIYQPRGPGEPLRWVECTPQELLTAYSLLCERLDAITTSRRNDLVTSSHCGHCAAAPGCPAHQRAAFNAVDVALSRGAYAVNAAGMRSELDLLDRAAEFIKQRIKWVEGAALAEMRAGKAVPGVYSKQQLGHTKWRDGVGVTELRLLGNNYIDEVPCSPAEAKRRGMTDEQYAKITHRPVTGVKLIRGDGSEQAAKVFGASDKPKRGKKS